jgi:hypothetical protein
MRWLPTRKQGAGQTTSSRSPTQRLPDAASTRADQAAMLGRRVFPKEPQLARLLAAELREGTTWRERDPRLTTALHEADGRNGSRQVERLITAADSKAANVHYARMCNLAMIEVPAARTETQYLLTAALADCDAIFVDIRTASGTRIEAISHDPISLRTKHHRPMLDEFAQKARKAAGEEAIASVDVYMFQFAPAELTGAGIRFKFPDPSPELIAPLVAALGPVKLHRYGYDSRFNVRAPDRGTVVVELPPGADAHPKISAWGRPIPREVDLSLEQPVNLLGIERINSLEMLAPRGTAREQT